MFTALEDWLLNKFWGKLVARGTVTLAGALAAGLAQPKASSLIASAAAHGVQIQLDPTKTAEAIIAAGIGAGHLVYEWFKARRMANPDSPAVQTDSRLIDLSSRPVTPGIGLERQ